MYSFIVCVIRLEQRERERGEGEGGGKKISICSDFLGFLWIILEWGRRGFFGAVYAASELYSFLIKQEVN